MAGAHLSPGSARSWRALEVHEAMFLDVELLHFAYRVRLRGAQGAHGHHGQRKSHTRRRRRATAVQVHGNRPGGACTSRASMSRIFQGGPGRGEYLCSKCARRGEGAPVSDCAPLRALLLYAVTAVGDDEDIAVRMKPVRIVLSAPPNQWGWGTPQMDGPELQMAQPEWREPEWRYKPFESDQIWYTSAPFRGTPASD